MGKVIAKRFIFMIPGSAGGYIYYFYVEFYIGR